MSNPKEGGEPKIEKEPYQEKDKSKLPEIIESSIITRQDIVDEEESLTKLPRDIRKKLKTMKPFMNSRAHAALRVALCIKHFDNKDPKRAERLNAYFKKAYGLPLTRMYNIVSSTLPGGMDGFEFIWFCFEEITKEEKSLECGHQFQMFIDNILKFIPYAVWVIQHTSPDDILTDVNERIVWKKIPEVAIYALGKYNVDKVLMACDIMSRDTSLDVQVELYSRRSKKAVRAIIKKKSKAT
jgi:hypothetical protein